MKHVPILFLLFSIFVMPVSALELEAPAAPESAEEWMPDNTDSFGEGLAELAEKAFFLLCPELKEAGESCLAVICVGMLISILRSFPGNGKQILNFAGTAAVSVILLQDSNTLIHAAASAIRETSDYGKLLLPVMTAAMAAQGGVTASAALYTGTAAFNTLLGNLLSDVFLPAVYLVLAISAGYCATGEGLLKRLRDMIKNAIIWCLKILLTIFTTYMSLTGVVSGTTDAAALKAAKVTISSVVPIVGGILSDASEAVLVSAGLMKNAAGIYGIFAVLAVFLEPFVRIGAQYVMLKLTAGLCCVFEEGGITTLVEDVSSAMGLLLAMTGSACLLLLISTVCFMRGVN